MQFYLALLQDLDLDAVPLPRYVINPLRQMGQILFTPPNVRGWVGGRNWINSTSLAARRALVEAGPSPHQRAEPHRRRIARHRRFARAEGQANFAVADSRMDPFAGRFDPGHGGPVADERLSPTCRPHPHSRDSLRAFIAADRANPQERLRRTRRALITTFLESPEYQSMLNLIRKHIHRGGAEDERRTDSGSLRPPRLRGEFLKIMSANPPTPFLPTTRREISLTGRGIGLLAFSRFAPSFLAATAARAASPSPERDRTILVLVQLAGGNDGLNTLVPFSDDNYRRLRPTIGTPGTIRSSASATRSACTLLRKAMQALFHEGRLGIVQNVGYPNPNHSHFRSSEIWETASASGDFLSTGWIGRYMDNACAGRPADSHDPLAIHVNTLNGEPEDTFIGGRERPHVRPSRRRGRRPA